MKATYLPLCENQERLFPPAFTDNPTERTITTTTHTRTNVQPTITGSTILNPIVQIRKQSGVDSPSRPVVELPRHLSYDEIRHTTTTEVPTESHVTHHDRVYLDDEDEDQFDNDNRSVRFGEPFIVRK